LEFSEVLAVTLALIMLTTAHLKMRTLSFSTETTVTAVHLSTKGVPTFNVLPSPTANGQ
jgi:hypothetical protein